ADLYTASVALSQLSYSPRLYVENIALDLEGARNLRAWSLLVKSYFCISSK
ncbi:MAG: hypothetical protein ACI9LU_001683, partial [Polaribacter sp.]